MKNANHISPPESGQIFYNQLTGEMEMFDGANWIIIPVIDPMDTNANFRIFIANDIVYAKITKHEWWIDINAEIHQWLNENEAGYYIAELRAISFFDPKFATAFQLQYG